MEGWGSSRADPEQRVTRREKALCQVAHRECTLLFLLHIVRVYDCQVIGGTQFCSAPLALHKRNKKQSSEANPGENNCQVLCLEGANVTASHIALNCTAHCMANGSCPTKCAVHSFAFIILSVCNYTQLQLIHHLVCHFWKFSMYFSSLVGTQVCKLVNTHKHL